MLESAGVEVEAKLVHSLQGKVEHPTPAFCPGPAGDLCWLFFFISARFWGATTSSTMGCLSRFTLLGHSGFELVSFQVLPAQALCSSRPLAAEVGDRERAFDKSQPFFELFRNAAILNRTLL